MAISFANAFSVHDDAMLLRSRRAEVLADNLANVDTPNFKARDIDFQAALAGQMQHQQGLQMAVTQAQHRNGIAATDSDLMYRTPHQPSIDGNTVEDQVEQAEFMQNALEFQISFQFLNSKIKGVKAALKGE